MWALTGVMHLWWLVGHRECLTPIGKTYLVLGIPRLLQESVPGVERLLEKFISREILWFFKVCLRSLFSSYRERMIFIESLHWWISSPPFFFFWLLLLPFGGDNSTLGLLLAWSPLNICDSRSQTGFCHLQSKCLKTPVLSLHPIAGESLNLAGQVDIRKGFVSWIIGNGATCHPAVTILSLSFLVHLMHLDNKAFHEVRIWQVRDKCKHCSSSMRRNICLSILVSWEQVLRSWWFFAARWLIWKTFHIHMEKKKIQPHLLHSLIRRGLLGVRFPSLSDNEGEEFFPYPLHLSILKLPFLGDFASISSFPILGVCQKIAVSFWHAFNLM